PNHSKLAGSLPTRGNMLPAAGGVCLCGKRLGRVAAGSDKGSNRRRRGRKIAPARVARGPPRAQVKIPVGGPTDAKGRRQSQTLDLGAAAKRIPFALNDERGTSQTFQVRRAQLGGSVGRMEGVAEADQARDQTLVMEAVGDQARHATTHGFATDKERCTPGR